MIVYRLTQVVDILQNIVLMLRDINESLRSIEGSIKPVDIQVSGPILTQSQSEVFAGAVVSADMMTWAPGNGVQSDK